MSLDAVGCSHWKSAGGELTGNAVSFDASSTYFTAPGTEVQLIPNDSHGWKVLPPRGWLSVGVAGTPAPAPVTVKLRTADHGPCTTSLLTACTRQKYVPGARPLTVALVTGAVTESCRVIFVNVDDALTCQL